MFARYTQQRFTIQPKGFQFNKQPNSASLQSLFRSAFNIKKFSSCCGSETFTEDKQYKVGDITILWGSQTGTAKSFAEDLYHQIQSKNMLDKKKLKIVDMLQFKNDDLKKQDLVIFLTSCYGEGEPPDNAKPFFRWIMDPKREDDPLKNIHYSIFGLGSSKAHRERYQVVGRYLDERLTELEAAKYFPTGEGDDSEDIEADFENWKKKLLEKLEATVVKEELAAEVHTHLHPVDREVAVVIHKSDAIVDQVRTFDPKKEIAVDNYFPAKLIQSVNVTPKSKRTTREITLSVKNSNIKYAAGDYLCVLPKNSEDNIQKIAKRLNVNLDSIFSLAEKSAMPPQLQIFKGKNLTVRNVLENFVDLQAFPSPTVIRNLSTYAFLAEDRDKLIAYSEIGKKYSVVKTERLSILDLLLECPSVTLSWLEFLEMSPALIPRYYSIASSSFSEKEEVSLVVRKVNYFTPNNRPITGLCSSYITGLSPEPSEENCPTVLISHKHSTFRLPEDTQTPVIMIAGGCGIAPFVGFLKERMSLIEKKANLGPAYLFFGCRNEDEMMFHDLIKEAVKLGAISNAFLAFSEGPTPKMVTDLVHEEKDSVYPLMEKGHIFMCGADFAVAAHQAFCKVIVNSTNCSYGEAEAQMKKMIFDNRYHEDLQ